uniref:Thiolase C-terminal domain-containing protein n=1 Tax=Babesia bovis TaxID=5865 RepID=Q95UG8_BABBO|nr:unknown [Babesia bovis]
MIMSPLVSGKNNHKYGGLWITPPQQKVSEDILPKLHNPKNLSGSIKTICTLADGAACLLLANDDFVNRLGISPYARILSYCEESVDGSQFPKALVGVIKKIIAEVNHRVDLYDIMDQYALLSVYASRNLDIDHSRINTNGSTIAIGHPMGRFKTEIHKIPPDIS